MKINSNRMDCTLTCRSFMCSKRMLKVIRDRESKSFICRMDDYECLGYSCSYAECRDRLLSDDGRCLKPVQKEQKRLKVKNLTFEQHNGVSQQNLDDRIQKKISRKLK